MDHTKQAAVFSLLDLPLELIERVISHAHSSCLVRLYRTSHLLKEMSNSPGFWRNRIHKEKKKIICISADETDWKRIFFKSIQFLTLQQAMNYIKDKWKLSKVMRWNLIFAPGVYLLNETIILLPNVDICGLWDTPWSQKPESQQTKLISSSKSIFRFDPQGEAPGRAVSIKNLTIETCKKGKEGRVACSLQKFNFAIENCDFQSRFASALFIVEATVTIKNCRFRDSHVGIFSAKDCEIHASGCVFAKNATGIRATGCKRSMILEGCSFMKNKSGIILTKSSATSIIKKCRFAGNEERGITMKPNSECLLFENQLTNNAVGLAVFENATVGLSKNIILNNKRHGVVMRYDVNIDFVTDNQIKNNGVTGLSMPSQCSNTQFTVEELSRSNSISENKIDIVLYPKRPNYEILYQPGDSTEVIIKNCAVAVSRYMCTFAATQLNPAQQESYECHTCGHSTVCVVCAKRCHLGHALSAVTVSQFYCDCGAEPQCQALNVLNEPS